MGYTNLASSDHPATIIYLVNISGSMNTLSDSGKTRIVLAKDALQVAYAQMIQRSLRQGILHPRYRVGVIAYSDQLFDVYDGFLSVDKLKGKEIPNFVPQHKSNMAKALRYAAKLIRDDIQRWPLEWLIACPPPLVVNITDYDFESSYEDLVIAARELCSINVPDGNVLLQNIYISDHITVPPTLQEWHGYHFDESVGNLSGDVLLSISSPMPASYREIVSTLMGIEIDVGSAMMFPGVNHQFIKAGFAMSVVSGSQIRYSRFPNEPDRSEYKKSLSLRPLRIFLCHSSDDKARIRRLYNRLANENWLDPWLDEKKLMPGQDWNLEIREAVAEADVVIVCLSKNSINKEGFVQKEIKMALDKADEKPDGTIFIIPLKLENCIVPSRLAKWQWLDAYGSNWFEKLLAALNARANNVTPNQLN